MSQDDQRAQHLDDAEAHLSHTRLGTTRYEPAIRCLIQHLRSLPSEPKVETGEGDADGVVRLLRRSSDGRRGYKEGLRAAIGMTDDAIRLVTDAMDRQDEAELNARAGSEGARAPSLPAVICIDCGKPIGDARNACRRTRWNEETQRKEYFAGPFHYPECPKEPTPPAASEKGGAK